MPLKDTVQKRTSNKVINKQLYKHPTHTQKNTINNFQNSKYKKYNI